MSLGTDSINKILKDETRRKIVLLLNDKGSLSYTDIMSTLQITSTGTLNYHLKVLGELLQKDESGQYMLSEKGRIAARFLIEFPQQNATLKDKKKWWARFWAVYLIVPIVSLLLLLNLYFSHLLDTGELIQGIFGYCTALLCTYVLYQRIRSSRVHAQQNPTDLANRDRTIQDVFVSGRQMQEIHEAIQRWINDEGITVEIERDGFVRGRLGTAGGLGLTAPKYFEVSWKPDQNNVIIHTEGWMSLYDLRELSFSKDAFSGRIPRRKGLKVMEHLWDRLKEMSIIEK